MGMTESVPVSDYSRQLQLPIFPSDAVRLGSHYSVMQRDDQVWYFLYDMPVFSHGVDDIASFRMYTSSLCDQGHCKLVEVERAFNVSAISPSFPIRRYFAQFQGIQGAEKPKVGTTGKFETGYILA